MRGEFGDCADHFNYGQQPIDTSTYRRVYRSKLKSTESAGFGASRHHE